MCVIELVTSISQKQLVLSDCNDTQWCRLHQCNLVVVLFLWTRMPYQMLFTKLLNGKAIEVAVSTVSP